jgi:hypothetical protein
MKLIFLEIIQQNNNQEVNTDVETSYSLVALCLMDTNSDLGIDITTGFINGGWKNFQ